MKIIFFSTSIWNYRLQVGSHHLAREYAEMGHEVLYISAPLSALHIFNLHNKSSKFFQRLKYAIRGVQQEGNVKYFTPFSLFSPANKPFLKNRWLLKNWNRFTIPNLDKKIKETGFANADLIYFDFTYYNFTLNNFNCLKIYRIADDMSKFSYYTKSVRLADEELVKSVDLVLVTSKNLKKLELLKLAKQCLYLPNAFNPNHFPLDSNNLISKKLISHKSVIYVGSFDFWFDFNILNYSALQNPNVEFLLYGPLYDKKYLFGLPANVKYMGEIAYNKVREVLLQAWVGIIPFNITEHLEFMQSVHPLKYYEYIACGLHVIATSWGELDTSYPNLFLAQDKEEFALLIKKALSLEKPEIPFAFLKNNNWKNRALTILNELRINNTHY